MDAEADTEADAEVDPYSRVIQSNLEIYAGRCDGWPLARALLRSADCRIAT